MLVTSFGMRYKRLELNVFLATELQDTMRELPGGVHMVLGSSVFIYSYLGTRFRLRHGVAFGAITDMMFERESARDEDYPLFYARAQLVDIMAAFGPHLWLILSPLNVAYPTLYELICSIRYDFEVSVPVARKAAVKNKRKSETPDVYFSFMLGMAWWQHHDPPVVGVALGSLGLHWKHFEIGFGFGSPAWAQFRKRGLYEFRFDLAFTSLTKKWLRLRHGMGMGVLFHNPDWGKHEQGYTVHIEPCMVDFALGVQSGFWLSLAPLAVSLVDGDHFASTLSLRYEI